MLQNESVNEAIHITANALSSNPHSKWILGFSGGKDSTCLLKIFSEAVNLTKEFRGKIEIIYCDTGVENPALDQYVKNLFLTLGREFSLLRRPFQTRLLIAPVQDRFFVKIIGRGYPPPTNSFRWCTKNLRIKPVSNFIKSTVQEDAVVALGLRSSESNQRDRSMDKNGGGVWQTQVEAGNRYRLFLPILNLAVEDVWEAVLELDHPSAIDGFALAELYKGASGECPIVKAPTAPPCGSGRFGCWTCTVVRKDHSAIKLIEAGYHSLKPYLEFRNWLSEIRNDPARRWPQRRNGSSGLGPFTMNARKEIFRKLRHLEKITEKQIINDDENIEIKRLWNLDKKLQKNFVI